MRLVSLLVLSCLANATAKHPNIVLFLIDDMGWSDSTVYGSTYYETPSMERLAREGMKFTSAYLQPLCSPTRATLMTGKDAPSRLQMHQAITGNGAQFGPQKQGFEKVIGTGGAGPGPSYFGSTNIPMLKPGPKGEYICERLTNEACKLLDERDPAKPFFMYFAHFNVHSPYTAKPELVEHFKKTADSENPQQNPVMAAMIRSMDDSLGQLLDKLDSLNLADDTLFVFLSDNGGVHWKNRMSGGIPEMNPTSNLPLRGGKCCFYEGGIRVPMIVRFPGKIAKGSTNDTPVHAVDFFPTFLASAGLKAEPNQALDGENLLPILTGTAALKRDTLYGHFPRAKTLADTVGGSWIRQGDLKLIRLWFAGKDGAHAYELYNIKQDIGENKITLLLPIEWTADGWPRVKPGTDITAPISKPAAKT